MPFWPSSIDILSFGTYIAFGIVRAEATKAKALRTYVKLKV